jgi:hypothetical protein
MPVPSSTVLNTSNQNYQAMLTTEPLDTANIVDVPADLSTPFDYLTNGDTDADNADLCSARRWAWYYKDPACPKYWSAWSCKSNFWLHLYETAVHRADVRTHIRVGRRELAREWRVEMVLRRATSRPRWCRLLRRNMLSSCSRDRYVC